MKLPRDYGTPLNPIVISGSDIYQEYERVLDKIFGGDGCYFVTATQKLFRNGKDSDIVVFVEDGDGDKHQLVFSPSESPLSLLPEHKAFRSEPKSDPKPTPPPKPRPKPTWPPKFPMNDCALACAGVKKPTATDNRLETVDSTVDPDDEFLSLADSIDPSKVDEVMSKMNEAERIKALDDVEKEAAELERGEKELEKKLRK